MATATGIINDGYKPSDDEPFMNDRQRDYFRRKLTHWKDDILRESRETLATLQSENENHPDIADRASSETDRAIELRARLTGNDDAGVSQWSGPQRSHRREKQHGEQGQDGFHRQSF